jgi:Bacterial low temperature requirement A protein (LtrA)
VLAEVIVGVAGVISDADQRGAATGIIGLAIGMGLWWNSFNLLGRRFPAGAGRHCPHGLYAHLPMTMAIAAGGAAMVSIVEHAADNRTPAAAAWLLTASVTLVLMGPTLAATALPGDEFPPGDVAPHRSDVRRRRRDHAPLLRPRWKLVPKSGNRALTRRFLRSLLVDDTGVAGGRSAKRVGQQDYGCNHPSQERPPHCRAAVQAVRAGR